MLNIQGMGFTDLYLTQQILLDLLNLTMEELFKQDIPTLVRLRGIVICEITLHQLGQINEMLQSQLEDILPI